MEIPTGREVDAVCILLVLIWTSAVSGPCYSVMFVSNTKCPSLLHCVHIDLPEQALLHAEKGRGILTSHLISCDADPQAVLALALAHCIIGRVLTTRGMYQTLCTAPKSHSLKLHSNHFGCVPLPVWAVVTIVLAIMLLPETGLNPLWHMWIQCGHNDASIRIQNVYYI